MKRTNWIGLIAAGLFALAILGIRLWINHKNAETDAIIKNIMDTRKTVIPPYQGKKETP